jgi:hypothetical protein
MTSVFHRRPICSLIVITLLLLTAGCRSDTAEGTPDYPVTVIPPAPTVLPTQTASPVPPSPEASATPTLDWSAVTLLPPRTSETEPEASAEMSPEPSPEPPAGPMPTIPDPLTEANLDLLVPGGRPFTLSDAEISLGRVVLPVDLISLVQGGPFSIRSIPVEGYPAWRFLAFSLPLPETGELGAVVRAPIDGVVMWGMMQMINNQRARVVNIDHALGEEQLLRASLVYTGTIEPLFVWEQEVEAGDVLFRLTRDTGRLETLGDTIILGGATLTLHVAIDKINRPPSGIEELVFLRGVSLTPGSFLKDRDGLIISPVN